MIFIKSHTAAQTVRRTNVNSKVWIDLKSDALLFTSAHYRVRRGSFWIHTCTVWRCLWCHHTNMPQTSEMSYSSIPFPISLPWSFKKWHVKKRHCKFLTGKIYNMYNKPLLVTLHTNWAFWTTRGGKTPQKIWNLIPDRNQLDFSCL